MNKSKLFLVILPLVLVSGAIGYFGVSWLTSDSMKSDSEASIAGAITYESGPFRVTVGINPEAPRVGDNQFTVKVADKQGTPVTGASIKAYGEMPAMGAMAAMRAPADLDEVEPGLYSGPLNLEMRGEWPLSLFIQTKGVGETRLGFDMATGRQGLSITSGGRPVANAMGGDKMAEGKSPEKNDRGFYEVGKYQIKVEVLGSGAMTRGDSMMGDKAMKAGDSSGKDAMMGGQTMGDGAAMMEDKNMSASMADEGGMMKGAPKSKSMSGQMSADTPDDMENMEGMKKGTAMMAGKNVLQVTVLDSNDQPVNGAKVRVAVQRETAKDMIQGDAMSKQDGMTGAQSMDNAMQGKRNSAVVQFESAGEGVYRGMLTLPAEGDYALAVDVSTEKRGHGDLVLAFTTGEYGLRAATATPEGIAYYTCSMHTSVREAGPGQCPICSMDLVPVTNEQVQSGVVTVDARRRQLIGVETGTAELRKMTKTIRAVGQVDFDERRIHNVTLKFDAWIGDLKADYVGTQVKKGEMLFSVYSPELLSAQQEYLETRQRLAARGPDDSLVRAARKRLMLWDISPGQVRAIERRGEPYEYLPIFAPASGTVVEKMINEGSHMNTGDMLLRIADLSTVWIDAEVYEADLPLIKKGMTADVTLPYGPERTYQAKVDYIYPYLEGKTRTARIRLVLDNPSGALKPDMYAEVRLRTDLGQRLMVPEGAVLLAGESRVVFKDMGEDGKLKPVRVQTGQRVEGWIEITQGLAPGDEVITSGNFLIASEAKLKTGIEQW